jgi:hypothetical protein
MLQPDQQSRGSVPGVCPGVDGDHVKHVRAKQGAATMTGLFRPDSMHAPVRHTEVNQTEAVGGDGVSEG